MLPEGVECVFDYAFKNLPNLETITFPASMKRYGNDADLERFGNFYPPVANCRNLKYVVFLSEDPATAVYPIALGKMCDWYVPDSMVAHVKEFIKKTKEEHPYLKGVGAKSVKPLSKLNMA